jgi:alkylation response protein AidB-like acyl-CoA dehydrogenase
MFVVTADQQLFAETTSRFLEASLPPSRIRQLARQADGVDPDLWRKGAELGWMSLLVPDHAGGGSLSENGLLDMIIVAAAFGRHAAPGPVLSASLVAAALGRWGTQRQQHEVLAPLLEGDEVAAWGGPAAPGQTPAPGVTARRKLSGWTLRGTVPFVESAEQARFLLVAADGSDGSAQFLIPMTAAGIKTEPLHGVDMTRRFARLRLQDVVVADDDRVGDVGSGMEHDAELLDTMAVLLAAEITGAMARAVAMTLQWAIDRYSFGRPLASYQVIKHRMADMTMHLEASEAVTARAAAAVGTTAPDARMWAWAAKAYAARYGPEVIQDCIQIHGGIGVTYEHDLHLFLRRATLDAQLYGTVRQSERRLAQLIDAGSK